MNTISYGIIKENNETFRRERTLLPCKWENKSFILIEKQRLKDNSEAINRIVVSDNILDLHKQASEIYSSWYNYPLGLCKLIGGTIKEL